MRDTTPRPLATDPPPRYEARWIPTLFGAFFLLFAGYVVDQIVHAIYRYPASSPVRQHLALPFAFLALFPLVGLFFLVPGLWSVVRAGRLRRSAAAHPGEPWFGDFLWSPAGYRERIGGWFAARIGPLLVIAALLFPFHYWAWVGAPWMLLALLAAVDLLIVLLLGWMGLRALRKLRYGAAFVRYESFPFFLGEALRVRVGTARPLPAGVPLEATLRAVEERLPRAPGVNRLDLFQIWADEQTVAFDGASREIALTFPLPADGPSTELDRGCRHWWELHLHAKRPGADFDETWLVPVYRRG